uniref:coiled-coil domain-containing protein R3HCC1L n=1 Tax=Erigeron canadensis TaxID=72917 RepID=UPI001CB8A56C|nr:coiled-coil domain-containing protein R3HCC1L [Erigeron canadensis]
MKAKKRSIFPGTSLNMEAKEDSHLSNEASCNDNSEDDWEAVADCAPDEILLPQGLLNVSRLTLEDKKVETPVRRGRGTFSYQKDGLYSDELFDGPIDDISVNKEVPSSSEGQEQTRYLKYGTRHVLVMEGFQPSMTTSGLENMLEKFNYHDVVIRWVNDTTALAVFRTPEIALEACNSIKCPFMVRVLGENDVLISSLPEKDLEPPRQRPKTSARTAQRLIAQGMGVKLPSTSFGKKELKEQEEARRQRIISRQHLKDDAWGD